MGNEETKAPSPLPSPPPSEQLEYYQRRQSSPQKTLTEYPWRKLPNWNAELEESIISDIKKLDPPKKPNILLLGPAGNGKSSFINSILSIGKGRKRSLALTGKSTASYTVDFEKFTDTSLLVNYRLSDCMGIEASEYHGFLPEDIIALLKGHIMLSYKFNPASPISEEDPLYRKNPEFEHQTHCVVFVISALIMCNGIPREYIQKIKHLQEKIKRAGIPRVLVLTKVDELCDEVAQDMCNLFRSVKIRDAVKVANEVFGIEIASIHPVKNYEVDFELDYKTNIPLLFAIRQAMQYAEDRVEKVLTKLE